MNTDRFESDWHKRAFPDPQEELIEFATCKGCGSILYEFEEILHNSDGGYFTCDDFICLIRASKTKRIIARVDK